METRGSYILVGLFVIGLLAGAFYFTLWLGGGQDNNEYYKYSVNFDESINGLNVGSIVRFRGVAVGKVNEISIDGDFIKVMVEIDKKVPITNQTKATLKFQGITGLAFIELVGSTGTKFTPKDGAVPTIKSDKSELSKLFQTTPDLLENANEITYRLNLLLSVENIENFGKTMANLEKISSTVSKDDKKIAAVFDQTNKTLIQLSQTANAITAAANAVNKVAAGSGDNTWGKADITAASGAGGTSRAGGGGHWRRA